MNFRQIVAPVLIVALTLVLAFELPQAIAARDRDYDWYTPVIDVRTLLDERFVREIDLDAMQRAAISAMVDSLGDPHTIYVPPRNTMVFEKEMSGQYTGIGAEIRGVNDRLMIITPLDGSPALEAGLRNGDVLLTRRGRMLIDQHHDWNVFGSVPLSGRVGMGVVCTVFSLGSDVHDGAICHE